MASIGFAEHGDDQSELVSRSFELAQGELYVVFTAADVGDLPPHVVGRELRVAAAESEEPDTRSIGQTILSDMTSGLIGNGTFALLGVSLTATMNYLRKRPRRTLSRLKDVDAVDVCLRRTFERLYHEVPGPFADLRIAQRTDGGWDASFACNSRVVRAAVSETGSVILWRARQMR